MDNGSNLTVNKTDQYSTNWLLSNEPRLFLLSLLGQILGLALISYGLSFLKTNELNFWQRYVNLAVPALIIGIATTLRPGPNDKNQKLKANARL